MNHIRFFKPLLFGIFILLLCLIPSESIQKIDFLKISFQDLVVHLLLFFIFSLLLALDFKKYKILKNNRLQQVVVLLMITISFSALTELLQYAFTALNRSANVGDFLFDFIGSVAGIVVVVFIKQ